MSKKPIIGIIGKYQGKWGEDIWNKVDIADEIRYLVVEKYCNFTITNRKNT